MTKLEKLPGVYRVKGRMCHWVRQRASPPDAERLRPNADYVQRTALGDDSLGLQQSLASLAQSQHQAPGWRRKLPTEFLGVGYVCKETWMRIRNKSPGKLLKKTCMSTISGGGYLRHDLLTENLTRTVQRYQAAFGGEDTDNFSGQEDW